MKIALKVCSGFVIILSTNQAAATRFECTAGNQTRIISVVHQHQGWELPCKVRYDKLYEGSISYPWEAESTKGYCREKAEFLAEKLKKLGWKCALQESLGLLY
tara:strand:+ start:321 stop:629 length:309 start_codon:yes stop_codon:yes gene_type:complete